MCLSRDKKIARENAFLLTVAFLGVHGQPKGDQRCRAEISWRLKKNHVVRAEMREKQVRGAMNQPPLLYSRRYYGFICSGGLEPSEAPNPPEASAERGVASSGAFVRLTTGTLSAWLVRLRIGSKWPPAAPRSCTSTF